jgi:hypothetical protein
MAHYSVIKRFMQGLHGMPGSMCIDGILLKISMHFFFVCQVCGKQLQYPLYIPVRIVSIKM